MTDLKDVFSRVTQSKSFIRVDNVHPLDLYVGTDEMSRWTLLMLCNIKPRQLTSSRMIHAVLGQRPDGRWSVSLSLVKEEYRDMFVLFCGDIVESSRAIRNKDKAAAFVVNRYKEWKEMLAGTGAGLLGSEEIKGLIGEMYVLDSELMQQYGPEKAAMSWTGPKAGRQDFVLDDAWFEVKISSVEQLDCQNNGTLIVVYADKTSRTDANAIDLNKLYTKLLSRLTDDEARAEFSNMLLKYGYYPRYEYESPDCTFAVKGTVHYNVTKQFPCLRRGNIPTSITRASYYISLPTISEWKEVAGNGAE